MKTEYAHALVAAINEGVSIDTALTGLKRALDRKHHSKLYAPVLLEVVRTLEANGGGTNAIVTVAKASDAAALKSAITAALAQLGTAKDTQVMEVVDETLIGGFVATYDYKEFDQSYKKALKSLYESIVK
jgi:F0F1-type ATP synthase delta subunit